MMSYRSRSRIDAGLILISVVMGLLRVAGNTSEVFQAVAHLWVGGLLGVYLAGNRRLYLTLAIALSALETACFLFGVGK